MAVRACGMAWGKYALCGADDMTAGTEISHRRQGLGSGALAAQVRCLAAESQRVAIDTNAFAPITHAWHAAYLGLRTLLA